MYKYLLNLLYLIAGVANMICPMSQLMTELRKQFSGATIITENVYKI